jgi:hypothetical protein
MSYVKQVGTFLSLGVLMLGLAACSGAGEKGAPAAPGAAPAEAPAGDAPKK